MKKIILIIGIILLSLATLLIFNKSDTNLNVNASENEKINKTSDTETHPDEEKYDRIYKKDGKWYGVLEVDDFVINSIKKDDWIEKVKDSNLAILFAPGIVGAFEYFDSETYFYYLDVDFNRDLKNLLTVEIKTDYSSYCSKVLPCKKPILGGKNNVDAWSDTTTYTFDTNFPLISNPTLDDFATSFGKGDIVSTNRVGYDYAIKLKGDTLRRETDLTVNIIEYTYILEDYEVDDVNNLIQKQFDDDLEKIINNSLYPEYLKQKLINNLIEKYKDQKIEYDEEITSICSGKCEDEFKADEKFFDIGLDDFISQDQLDNIIPIIIIVALILIGMFVLFLIASIVGAVSNGIKGIK